VPYNIRYPKKHQEANSTTLPKIKQVNSRTELKFLMKDEAQDYNPNEDAEVSKGHVLLNPERKAARQDKS